MYDRSSLPEDVYEFYMRGDVDADGNLVEGSEGRNFNEGGFTCRLTGSTVGYQNFTYILDQDYGRSKTIASVKRLAPKNTIYDLQTYAKVTALDLQSMGTEGGGLLTISGNWFSPTDNQIFIDDIECTNVQVNAEGTQLTCTPGAGTAADANTFYEGNRGFYSYLYENANGEAYTDIQAKDTATADLVIASNLDASIHASQTENYTAFASYTRAFFKPVVDSDYEFNLVADDEGQIHFGGDAASADVENAGGNSYELVGGNSYPFEMYLTNAAGDGSAKPRIVQRDTRLSAQDYPAGATNHKQSVSASVKHENEIQVVTFNNVPEVLLADNTDPSSVQVCLGCKQSKADEDAGLQPECNFIMSLLGYNFPENPIDGTTVSQVTDQISMHADRFPTASVTEISDPATDCGNDQFTVGFTVSGVSDLAVSSMGKDGLALVTETLGTGLGRIFEILIPYIFKQEKKYLHLVTIFLLIITLHNRD